MTIEDNNIPFAELKKPQKEFNPFFDLDEIKNIPIEEVCGAWGLDVKEKGGSLWCNLRNEKTASCKLYKGTNTFCDFGDANKGGNVINLVSMLEGCSNQKAIEKLAETFGIEALNKVSLNHGFSLTNRQYSMINIEADLATKNFAFKLEQFGVERTSNFAEKYSMTIQELKKSYPNVYVNVVKQRAIPYVYEQRNEYYQKCFDYLHYGDGIENQLPDIMVLNQSFKETLLKEVQEKCKNVQQLQRLIVQAIDGCKGITYKPVHLDVSADLMGIKNGNISFEIGVIRYVELKQRANEGKESLAYTKMGYEDYKKCKVLSLIYHSAFYAGGEVNVASFAKDNTLLLENLNHNTTYKH